MELFLPLPGLWSNNFFYKMFQIWSKRFKINFQNGKWNHQNRKWNYFYHFQAFDQNTSFTKYFSFDPRDSKLILKQDMELFLPLLDLWSKNFFYKMFLICSKGFKIDFQNRKWNCPHRKWNYFSHFQASDQKTSFTKCFPFVLRGSKLIFKTENGIIQTGNGIISPCSRPLLQKLL